MADAVHDLTNNDNDAPGGAWSGVNGFPWPFGTASTGTGTDNPVKISFTDAVKWFRRVKNWKVTTSGCSLTLAGTTVSLQSGNMTAGSGFPTRELDLLKTGPITGGDQLTWGKFDTDGSGNTSSCDIAYAGLVSFPPWVMDDISNPASDLWPGFITGAVANLSFSPSGTAEVRFAYNPANLSAATGGTMTITIDGYSVTLYYSVILGSSAGSATFNPGAIAFDPVEYWPYAAADTSPIYNTSTGAQLQDPRN